jgi:hypothetical protein
MITMSLVEWRRSVEKIAFWHKSAAIEFLGVYIYIFNCEWSLRNSSRWSSKVLGDMASSYPNRYGPAVSSSAHSPFSLDKNDYDGNRFCLHEYKWFHLHPLVPLVISISQKEKQTTKPTHTNRSFHWIVFGFFACVLRLLLKCFKPWLLSLPGRCHTFIYLNTYI